METQIRILIIRLSGSSANALIIIRFNSENFFEFRYGLFFCENGNSVSRINDAPSGRYVPMIYVVLYHIPHRQVSALFRLLVLICRSWGTVVFLKLF
jgi:hypothetical protein